MAKQRVQVDPLAPAPRIQPRATSVDTFHRPNVGFLPEGPSELGQLAHALGQFQPTLQNVAVNMKNRDNTRQFTAGEQEVLKNEEYQTVKGLGDAVRAGKLPAARNPAFLRGMRRQAARLEGERFDQSLRQMYAESDSRNQEDISDFVGGFTAKYIENLGVDASDPEFARSMTPAIERSQSNLFQRHRGERDQVIEQTVEQNTEREIGLTIDKMEEVEGTTLESTAARIHGIVEDQYLNGLSGAKTNDIVARAIIARAKTSLNPTYLDLLDQIPSGSGTVGQVTRVKEARLAALESIYADIERRDRGEHQRQKVERDEITRVGLSQGLGSLFDDPSTNITDILKSLNGVDPEAAKKLFSWQQALISGADNLVENPGVVTDLFEAVYSGRGNTKNIGDAFAAGDISKETAKRLISDTERSREFRSITNDRTVRDAAEGLFSAIRGSEQDFREVDAEKARRTKAHFYRTMANWKKGNPEADELEMLDYIEKVSGSLMRLNAPQASTDADAATVAGLSAENAMTYPADLVPWQTKAMWSDNQDLDGWIAEWRTLGKTRGRLQDLANYLGTTPQELVKAQRLHLAKGK